MAELSGPYEFLDLSDGASATIQVNSALEGEATIFPVAPTARHVAQHMAQNGLSTAPPAGNPIGVKIQIVRRSAPGSIGLGLKSIGTYRAGR